MKEAQDQYHGAKEEIIMDTNKKENNKNELNLDELEQISGGSVLAAIGLGCACVGLAVQAAKFGRKIYKDLTSK